MVSADYLRDAYDAIFEVMGSRSDIRLIVKAKREDFRRLGHATETAVESLLTAGRAELRVEHGDLSSGLNSDIVVGVGPSTLGLLAAQHGRHTLIMDPERALVRSPAGKLPSLRIVYDGSTPLPRP